ncbi:MAG: bifunctional transcriptional activator/DNA repair enzyme AdaA, partial [Nitrospiraceae bacterium]
MITDERAWQAVEERDASFDGRFVYGVITTGGYCRPSCRSRRPLRQNVRFFAGAADAEAAGLRACLKCRPAAESSRDAMTERISRLCDYIREHHDEPLTLRDLAEESGLSQWHLQRSFKAVTGISPREYIESCRMGTLKQNLREQKPVTESIYAAGFGSGSRVYERADTRLGMTPAEYRSGGKGVEISFVSVDG